MNGVVVFDRTSGVPLAHFAAAASSTSAAANRQRFDTVEGASQVAGLMFGLQLAAASTSSSSPTILSQIQTEQETLVFSCRESVAVAVSFAPAASTALAPSDLIVLSDIASRILDVFLVIRGPAETVKAGSTVKRSVFREAVLKSLFARIQESLAENKQLPTAGHAAAISLSLVRRAAAPTNNSELVIENGESVRLRPLDAVSRVALVHELLAVRDDTPAFVKHGDDLTAFTFSDGWMSCVVIDGALSSSSKQQSPSMSFVFLLCGIVLELASVAKVESLG